MFHTNARLTTAGQRLLVNRNEARTTRGGTPDGTVGGTVSDVFRYARMSRSETGRRAQLIRWFHDRNCHCHLAAVGGPPASRAQGLTGANV